MSKEIGRCEHCGLVVYKTDKNKYVGHSSSCKNNRTKDLKL